MSPDYHARVGGPGLTTETFQIDSDSDRDAIDTAFAAFSPFGHSLWDGHRFLGYFDAGESRSPRLHAAPAAIPPPPC